MSTNPLFKEPKPNALELVRGRLTEVAKEATDAEKQLVAGIQQKAKKGERAAEMLTLTPAVCALLFLNENGHNRDFKPNIAEEYARRARSGAWLSNNASIGFYADGEVADGQHRLAMSALSGFVLKDYLVVYGMQRGAIGTVDCGFARDGASHAKLDGIQEASVKQSIVKAHAAYMDRVNGHNFKLRSPAEVRDAIERNDSTLDVCIRLGEESTRNRLKPVFDKKEAAQLAYLLIAGKWPEDRVREKLALFQAGQSQDGENSPYFVAGTLINLSKDDAKKRDRLTGVKQLGVAIYAMVETEKGIKATTKNKIKDHVNAKLMPNPQYPLFENPVS